MGTEDRRADHTPEHEPRQPEPPQHAHNSVAQGVGFDAWSADTEAAFRAHFDGELAAPGRTFEQFWPAYRFGFDLGANAPNAGAWPAVEPVVRRKWERGQPGDWETYREAVRHAWDYARRRHRHAA